MHYGQVVDYICNYGGYKCNLKNNVVITKHIFSKIYYAMDREMQ